MTSHQTRQRRMQQLRQNLVVRVSLMDRQVEELLSNLDSYHSEVKDEAAQLMSLPSGFDQADVPKYQALIEKLDRRTRVIMSLNSSFFDLLDSEDDAVGESAGGSLVDVVATHDQFQRRAENSDTQSTADVGAPRVLSPAPASLGSGAANLLPPAVSLPHILGKFWPVVSQAAATVASSQTPYLTAAVPLLGAQLATGFVAHSPPQQQVPSVPLTSTMPLSGAQPVTVFTTHNLHPQPQVLSSLTLSSAAPVPSQGALPVAGFVTHQPPPFPTPSLSAASSASMAPLLIAPPSGFVPHPVRPPPVMPQEQAGPFVPGSMGTAQGTAVSQVPLVVAEAEERQLGQDELPTDSMVSVAVLFSENPWSFFTVKCRATVERLTEQIGHHVQQTRDAQKSVCVGILCLAQFTDGVCYRARVSSVHQDGKVTVYFVDFGNSHITNSSELLVLPDKFRELPALGIHCCLSGVVSSSKTGMWTEEAINQFENLVAGRDMICKAKLRPRDNPSLPVLVELFRPTPIQRMASSTQQSEPNVSNISIASLLLHLKLARPIDNEELLARLMRARPEVPSHLPAPSDCPPHRHHSLTSDPAAEAGPPASPNFEPQDSPVPEAEINALSASRLQDILRRVPKMPKKLAKRSRSSSETEQRGSTPPPCADPAGKDREEVAEAESHCESTSAYKALMQGTSDANDFVVFRAMAATVNSPTDFYMHKVSVETGKLLKNMMVDLNRIFEGTPKATLRFRSKKFDAKAGVLCCAQFRDDSYYRGLVLDTRASPDAKSRSKQIRVLFVDFGDKDWLPSSHVFPLPTEFHHISPQAIWCSLAYVRPLSHHSIHVSSGGDCALTWPAVSVAEFEKLVGRYGEEKVLEVLTSGTLPSGVHRADAVQKEPLQVILVDTDNRQLCINHDLIVRDLAAAAIPMSASEDGDSGTVEDHPVDTSDFDDSSLWNDMEADASSLRNTYQVDVDDAGVALTGVKSQGGQHGICRFYNTPSSCWKGEKCPFLHLDPGMQTGVSGNLKKVCVFDEDQSDLLPAEGAVVSVEISCVRNPSHFYVILPWGPFTIQEVASNSADVMEFLTQESLESLNTSMAKFYKDKRLDTDYSLYAPGEAVAAKCPRSGTWLRAKVVDIKPDDELVLVMFVDFGDMEWVPELDIRQLQDRFLPLPPQAVECCLMGVGPPAPHTTWPESSRNAFFSLVDGKTLVAHVKQRMWSGRLSLELYDTSQEMEDIDIRTVLIQKGLAAAVVSEDDSMDSPGQPALTRDGDVCYVPG